MTKTLQVLRALGPIDLKSIRRDSMLPWMVGLPILSALFLRWAVPPITQNLLERYGFDLTPYYPVLLAYFVIVMSPIVFAVLVGFLVLDEKDDQTLSALQITPLSVNSYLAYRIAIPVLLTIGLLFITFPLANLGSLPARDLLITALAAAPMAPMFTMYMVSQAQNKVQGFALMKLSGLALYLPIAAYFVHSRWEYAFGIFPTYWLMKVYWTLDAGEPGVWLYFVIAILYQTLITWFFIRRFNRIITR